MLLTGWIIFVFLAIALVKFLYIRFVKKSQYEESGSQVTPASESAIKSTNSETVEAVQTTLNGSARAVGSGSKLVETLTGPKVIQSNRPQRPLRRRRISKDSSRDNESSFDASSILLANSSFDGDLTSTAICSGPNADVVDYVTKCYEWLFGSQRAPLEDVTESFVDAMNRSLRETDKKVR